MRGDLRENTEETTWIFVKDLLFVSENDSHFVEKLYVMRTNYDVHVPESEDDEPRSGCFCPCLPTKVKKSDSVWRRKSSRKSRSRHSPTLPRPTLLLPPMRGPEGLPVIASHVQLADEDSQLLNVIYHVDPSTPLPSAPSPGHLFYNSEDHSDITFIVGHEEWRFPAHSFILNKSQPTLLSLLQASQNEVENISFPQFEPDLKEPVILKLPSLHPEVFEQLLRYIYTGQVKFSSVDYSLRLLHISRMYQLPPLTAQCLNHISNNVNATNVLTILSNLLFSEDPLSKLSSPEDHNQDNERNELVFKCFLIVDCHADDVLQSDTFETLQYELMLEIVKRDTLEVSSEAVVFDSMMRWACTACKRQRRELTPENKCTVLGKAIFLVRYLTMSEEEFLRGPVSQGMLNKEDKDIFLDCLTNTDPTTHISLPERWSSWKISVKRKTPEISSMNTAEVVSPTNINQPPKQDFKNERKKKSMSKKLLNGVGDLVICVIQLLD